MSEPDICLVCKDFKPEGKETAGKFIYAKLDKKIHGHECVLFWVCKYCIPTTNTNDMRAIIIKNL